jgi:hypothetical protein
MNTTYFDPEERLHFKLSEIVPGKSLAYYVTPCCGRDGKGSANSPTGVCCRGCYAAVDPIFGTGPSAADVKRITGLEVINP